MLADRYLPAYLYGNCQHEQLRVRQVAQVQPTSTTGLSSAAHDMNIHQQSNGLPMLTTNTTRYALCVPISAQEVD